MTQRIHFYEIRVCGKVLKWFVGNHWQVTNKLDEVKKGDVFEIKGIGRMRVVYIQLITKYFGEKALLTKRYLVRSDD